MRDEGTRTKDEGGRMKDEETQSLQAASDLSSSFILHPSSLILPKITDFGLAKRLEEGPGANTRTGSMLGTPSYMAPEQAAGLHREVGVATDVYALGAILYELLTGRPPFKGETPLATLEQVRRAEPEPPSLIHRKLPADLETICLKCLQKESSKRYASAKALAEDLERYLAHKPIRARRVGAAGRAARWFRRNPALAATMAAAAIVVAVVGCIGLWSVFEERDHYRQERDHAQANLSRALVGEARSQIDARDTGWWWRALGNLSEAAKLDVADRDLAGLRDLAIECMGSAYPCMRIQGTWSGHTGPVTTVVVSPDGRLAASGSRDQTVRIWSMPDGEPLAVLTGHTGTVTGLAFHPGSQCLASCSVDGSVRLWRLNPRAPSSGGASNGEFRLLQVFDPKAGRLSSVACSPDGAWLAMGCQDGKVHLFSLEEKSDSTAVPGSGKKYVGRERVLEGHSGAITCLAFSSTGELASSALDQTIRFWDIASGKQAGYSPIVGEPAGALSFYTQRDDKGDRASAQGPTQSDQIFHLPGNGELLAWTEPKGYTFRARNRLTGIQNANTLPCHGGPVTQVCWSSKGVLLSASEDGAMKAWRFTAKGQLEELAIAQGEFGAVLSAAFSPDGDWVAAGYFDGRVRLWQFALPPQRSIAWSDSQNGVFIGAEHRLVNSSVAYDFGLGMDPPAQPLAPEEVSALVLQSAGRHFAYSQGALLQVWDLQSSTELRQWRGHDRVIRALASSPNGLQLALQFLPTARSSYGTGRQAVSTAHSIHALGRCTPLLGAAMVGSWPCRGNTELCSGIWMTSTNRVCASSTICRSAPWLSEKMC